MHQTLRFELCYMMWSGWKCHEWKQSTNPMKSNSVRGYEKIQSDSPNYFFENFGGLQKAVVNSEQTTLEETNTGSFWIGILNDDQDFQGPPNYNDGLINWNDDTMKLSIYRKITSGPISHSYYKNIFKLNFQFRLS